METASKLKLSNLGLVLAFYGLGSVVLKLIGYNFILMLWVDYFGEKTGWVFRMSFIIIGFLLYFRFQVSDDELNFEEFEKNED